MAETPVKISIRYCFADERKNLIDQIRYNREFSNTIETLSKKPFKSPVEFEINTDVVVSPINSFSEYRNPRWSHEYSSGLGTLIEDFLYEEKIEQMLEDGTTIEFLCKKLIVNMTLTHLASAAVFLLDEKYIKKQNLLLTNKSYSLEFDGLSILGFDLFYASAGLHHVGGDTVGYEFILDFWSSKGDINHVTDVDYANVTDLTINLHKFKDDDSGPFDEKICRNINDKSLAIDLTKMFKEVLDKYYDEHK